MRRSHSYRKCRRVIALFGDWTVQFASQNTSSTVMSGERKCLTVDVLLYPPLGRHCSSVLHQQQQSVYEAPHFLVLFQAALATSCACREKLFYRIQFVQGAVMSELKLPTKRVRTDNHIDDSQRPPGATQLGEHVPEFTVVIDDSREGLRRPAISICWAGCTAERRGNSPARPKPPSWHRVFVITSEAKYGKSQAQYFLI